MHAYFGRFAIKKGKNKWQINYGEAVFKKRPIKK